MATSTVAVAKGRARVSRPLVRGALLLAMVIASSYASVPLPVGPVPMTLQSLAVLIAGVWGGPRLGAAVCMTYIALGAAGAPVFAGGGSAPGLTLLARPTAGYVLAFPLAAAVAGAVSAAFTSRLVSLVLGMLAGHLIIFVGGLAFLTAFLPLERAIDVGLTPFLAGTFVKVAIGTLLGMMALPTSRDGR